MINDPIVDELHRHREEMFREFGNDPEALVRYLQEKERSSGRIVQAPPTPSAKQPRLPVAKGLESILTIELLGRISSMSSLHEKSM